MTDKRLRWIIKCIGIVMIAAILFGMQLWLPDFFMTMGHLIFQGDLDGLARYIESFGYAAIIVSIGMLALVNAVGFPSILFLTVNGLIFGLIPGIIISWIGEVIGIEISFRLTRTLFHKQAKKLLANSQVFEKMDSHSGIKTLLLGRAIPYSPNMLVTAFGALSNVSYRDHFIADALGKLPAVIIEVWLGHDLLRIQEHWQRLIALVVLVALVYGLIWLRKRRQRKERIKKTPSL